VKPDLGWSELATGGVEIHEVPGTHLGMLMEPHVRVLGEKLMASIEKYRQETIDGER
jgi:aspartate racemase